VSGIVFRTAGESHGPALVGIVEGMPSGLALDAERIDRELRRRQRGHGRGGRMKIERDSVQLLSGLKQGVTLGSPVAFLVENRDAVLDRLPVPGDPRPGHADLAGCQKHGHHDPRAVLERASARETAARVAAGGVARQLLEDLGVEVFAHTVALGGVEVREDAFAAAGEEREALREASDLLSLDPEADVRMRAAVDAAKEAGDTLGGVFEVVALGLPPGLGGYSAWDERLTGRLAGALLSIPAMKGVEFGLGFEAARRPGSEVHDPIDPAPEGAPWGRFRRRSNRAGGLEGGMTTGEPLVVRVAMKPIPTLRRGLDSVDFATGERVHATWQRSDVTSVPAAGVVGEAMVALVLADAVRRQFGGDSMAQVRRAWGAYLEDLRRL
jgi:chorismate synthase